MARFLPVAAIFLLTAFVRWNTEILPVPWPDEALFSSPAAELAENRSFSTPVLSGLIYGMDRATLWNCPLHMVLLAQVYRLTGESLLAGRLFSLFLGSAALVLFYLLCRRVLRPPLAGIATIVLALDPVFQRASNTIRMDVLTLSCFFASLLFILKSRQLHARGQAGPPDNARASLLYALLAGLALGLASISHPFAAILLPVLVLFCLPNPRRLGAALSGAAAGFLPWAVYIGAHFDIFQEQFIEQLRRKAELSRMIAGGETGGLHRVFFSQYGFYDGSWPAMVVAALLYAVVVGVCVLYLLRRVQQGAFREADEQKRAKDLLVLSFLIIAGFAYFSSEGWYVVYGDAFLILAAAILASGRFESAIESKDSAQPGSTRGLQSLLWLSRRYEFLVFGAAAVLFPLLLFYFTARGYAGDNRNHTQRFLQETAAAVSTCKSVYLRVRPDPYFELRSRHPLVRVYEFIPGKLNVSPAHQPALYRTWDSVECFLIDQHDAWEPRLTEYLENNKTQFRVTSPSSYPPLNLRARLFRRIDVL